MSHKHSQESVKKISKVLKNLAEKAAKSPNSKTARTPYLVSPEELEEALKRKNSKEKTKPKRIPLTDRLEEKLKTTPQMRPHRNCVSLLPDVRQSERGDT